MLFENNKFQPTDKITIVHDMTIPHKSTKDIKETLSYASIRLTIASLQASGHTDVHNDKLPADSLFFTLLYTFYTFPFHILYSLCPSLYMFIIIYYFI